MSANHEATSHVQLQAVLDLAGVELRASEVQGMVCGEICRQLRFGPDSDFLSLLGQPDTASSAGRMMVDVLENLMDETRRSLNAGMQFGLLLPDDDEPLEERTASVADFARGFVLALLRGEAPAIAALPGEGGEFVRDLVKISEARPGGDAEEDERALVEIEEYMRVGVQLVYEELQPDAKQETADGSVN